MFLRTIDFCTRSETCDLSDIESADVVDPDLGFRYYGDSFHYLSIRYLKYIKLVVIRDCKSEGKWQFGFGGAIYE